MAEHESRWPFGNTGGGPSSRPLVVDMENVLIAMVGNKIAAERAEQTLREAGFTDENLRLYTSEQILDYDESWRSGRGLKDRVVGSLVDDTAGMGQYVTYARDGCSSLWILVEGREDANRVIRHLVDHELVYVWFHGSSGLETIHMP